MGEKTRAFIPRRELVFQVISSENDYATVRHVSSERLYEILRNGIKVNYLSNFNNLKNELEKDLIYRCQISDLTIEEAGGYLVIRKKLKNQKNKNITTKNCGGSTPIPPPPPIKK